MRLNVKFFVGSYTLLILWNQDNAVNTDRAVLALGCFSALKARNNAKCSGTMGKE